jgi:FkbH-like protein
MDHKSVKIKCVVWDLDNTIWNGILTEDANVKINKEILSAIQILDQRGILQSISSKNNFKETMQKLKEFQIDHFFLYPQIHWKPKSQSLQQIANDLNISIDTFAFVDDQPFELDEVRYSLQNVRTYHADEIVNKINSAEFMPIFITEDSKKRRQLYQTDIIRKSDESSFIGSTEEFLTTLNMSLTLKPATVLDLQRAEELTVRTHQLNTTGYTYSYDQLKSLLESKQHVLLVAELEDKYGHYGTIGLVLLERNENKLIIKLILMSCRVVSRGIGAVITNYLRKVAKSSNKHLWAEFIDNNRNRMMYMTYKLNGFYEHHEKNNIAILQNSLEDIPNTPNYIRFSAPKTLNSNYQATTLTLI